MKDNVPEKIVIRLPNWVGDLVMATPILEDVRCQFPKAHITAMTLASLAPLVANNPYIDARLELPQRSSKLTTAQRRAVIQQLRAHRFDLGILLTNSFSSALWFWQGRVRTRLGFCAHGRTLLLNRPLKMPPSRGAEHLVLTYKRLLVPLGIELTSSKPQLFVTEEEKKGVQKFITPKATPLIGFNPSSAYGPAKNWPEENFRALALQLVELYPNAALLFFGDAQSAPLVERICRDLPLQVHNLAMKTSLRELMALQSELDLFITNDSGPMHMAAALNCPQIAIFGSTSEIVTGPYGSGKVIRKPVSCSPCFLKDCPIDFRCMRRITVPEVVREAQLLLEGGAKAGGRVI